ncbi:alkyl hydroperoxide reductase/ Thiol specific antioxidant/ Mal allergen [Desulfofarcimen acetoxidans DSM 771]|jgi:thiol-disulfide isomerase/thioredoxin|uniref:Alkyl hydroperoxide reductase/ Thiol specific antioxidant/ Mal allergen n=1 Tax=Desulfofarcimen acetoxidans (strain ATCC 49208 / DSM 771 / KCTC 5769 / VKM B-1644 / 5575) TaxID=485916 RepID=C8VVW5_DESAS|nr:TlpA disulfide reductase family protein [Desulfofarcimen acetoxidans]ACV64252.1 alkyl hydroperoxide reductase/ Thiol specific antioxidant/ Mal allergen [Desulfofarcimen acetoxidans DSM 771]
MNPKIITIVIVFLLLALGFGLTHQTANESEIPGIAGDVSITAPSGVKEKLSPGQPPSFFITRDKKTTTLSSLKGKYIFINFWNTWCSPCKGEMPDLNRLYLDYSKKNVEFIFINIAAQEKKISDVPAFLKQNNLQIPVYLDKNAEVAATYGINAIPTTIIINPEEKVIYAAEGPISYEQASQLFKQ